jgi:hypothetical protein
MKIKSAGLRMVFFGTLGGFAGGCVVPASYFGTYGTTGVPVDLGNRPIATTASSPLLVSALEASSYSTRNVGLVEVTFENRTPVWKQVDHVAVEFGGPAKDQSVKIASGNEIGAWTRAMIIRATPGVSRDTTAIEALVSWRVSPDTIGDWLGQQQGVAAAPVAGTPPAAAPVAAAPVAGDPAAPAPAAAAPVAGDPAAPTPAAAAPVAGAPAAAGPAPSAVQAAPSYPDQHLLTVPFSIPPGLFVKRWILLSTPDNPPGGCVDSMVLSYETSDHSTGRVLLSFKIPASSWQPACRAVPSATPGNAGITPPT